MPRLLPLDKILTTKQKKTLRDFYNSENGVSIGNISRIASRMGISGAENTYRYLAQLYNDRIVSDRREREREQKRVKREEKYYKDNVLEYSRQEDWHDFLKRFAGKSVVIEIVDAKGGNVVRTRQDQIPDEGFNDWYKSIGFWIIWLSSGETIYDEYPDAVIYVYEGNKKIVSEKIVQYFKEGNVNCLLEPILAWAEEAKSNSKSASAKSRYNAIINRLKIIEKEIGDRGVDESAMNRISNDAQVDISVERPVIINPEDKYVVQSKASKKCLKHFIMRNTKIDHVELNELLYLNNIEIVSREKLFEIKAKLDCDRIYHEFSRDLDGISSINTLSKTWRLSNEFMEKLDAMEKEVGLNECYIDDMDDKDLSYFVNCGTHYNATIDFVKDPKISSKIKHQDMKNAYAKYKMCSEYSGFLGKITDFRKCSKIEGVGIYQIANLVIGEKLRPWNDKMKIYFDWNVYPSPELEWLRKNGATFDIIHGCWGHKTIDFDMEDHPFLFEKYDKIRGYAKYVGMCDSHYLMKRFSCYGDEKLANTMNEVCYYRNNEMTIQYPKEHNYHLGHFTAFILSYQRIQMMQQLVSMKRSQLIRVCVDGIYYTGDAKFSSVFVPKTKMTFNNSAGDSFISNVLDCEEKFGGGEARSQHSKELFIGEGGNGKTHKNLTDSGLIRILYVAPSWKLAYKKRSEYGCHSEVWANLISPDPAKFGSIRRRYNVIIVDEVSMMSEETKKIIFETYSNCKLIFCGDIGFQAPPFGQEGAEMNRDGFDVVLEETTNYRYKCPLLRKLVLDVRKMISNKRPDWEVNHLVKARIQHITVAELQATYTVEDMILSRTHEVKDQYTKMFETMNKWYITTNTRQFKNGMIVIGDKPETTCQLQHAYTVHSIQGETAENRLFIDVKKNYASRLLYTAISRAKTLEQVRLIV